MPKRSTKFYRKNESDVMKRLGFKPTKNSGAGWIEKEDGINDFAICQLKSTDKRSINIKQDDLHILERNACISHKLPVFAIQFLNTDEVWLMVKPDDIGAFKDLVNNDSFEVTEYLDKHLGKDIFEELDVDKMEENIYNVNQKSINKRNANNTFTARQNYMKQREKEKEQREKEYKQKQRERRNSKFGKKI